MASPKTLNAQNLEALGAARLAILLLELADGDAQTKRRLRLELASQSGGSDVADQVRKRIATIGKSKSYVDWNKIRPLADDLRMQHRAIVDHVARDDPAGGFDLLWRLIGLVPSIHERCDDSNGTIGGLFSDALADLPPLAVAGKLPVGTLVDMVFDSVCSNDYGQYDDLIASMAPPLGKDGLGMLKARFEAWAKTPPVRLPDSERRVIGYGSTGPLYEDDMAIRAHARTAKSALTDIADVLGDVDGFADQHSDADRQNPAIAAHIAERLLQAGRCEDALAALDYANAKRDQGGYWPDWDRVRIDALEVSGRHNEAQENRWALFTATLSIDYLRAYLKRLPDFEDMEAEERAIALVCSHPSFHQALRFLIAWPQLDAAAEMLCNRADELDGNHYELLTAAAEALDERHPLSATLALRAMIDFALEHARHKRYPHAVRHLKSCQSLARSIDDFGFQPDHDAYVVALKLRHGKKSGFWGG